MLEVSRASGFYGVMMSAHRLLLRILNINNHLFIKAHVLS